MSERRRVERAPGDVPGRRVVRARRSCRGGKRIIFASNYGDPKGREFDLWAIDVDGTRLERITYAPGFDGFPMFSPDGKRLVFASNRATPPGQHDTNVFVADWKPERRPQAQAPSRAGRSDPRRHPLAGRSGARGARHRHRRARGRRRVHRGALQGARPRAGGRRRRLPPDVSRCARASRSSPRRRCESTRRAVARDGVRAARVLGHRARRRGRCVLAGYGLVDKELGHRRLRGARRARKDRRRAPLRSRTPGAVDARAPAARRRPAAEGLDRARARRARAAGGRPAGARRRTRPPTGSRPRSRRCRRRGRAATATPGSRS